MKNAVKVSIEKATKKGNAAAYEAVAIEKTQTHFLVSREDWSRIANAPQACGTCEARRKREAKSAAITSGAAHLARGAVSAARSIAGLGLAEPGEIERRRAICEICLHSLPQRGSVLLRTCGTPGVKTSETCGCSLALKTRLQTQACPQAKW